MNHTSIIYLLFLFLCPIFPWVNNTVCESNEITFALTVIQIFSIRPTFILLCYLKLRFHVD